MAITNPSFESVGSWTYEENDTPGSISGARTTDWADQGIYSYQITHSDSVVYVGDYGRIKQNITIDKKRLRLKARWYNTTNFIFSMRVKFGAITLWSKTMNVGVPIPPIIENIDIDVSSYISQTDDLILELYVISTYASNFNGWVQWDSLVLYNDYYVKVGGNDSNDGKSWANAWKTINKAATTVPDGSIVHIGFGTYDAEPGTNKIAPQNVGSMEIYYLPETATTGGGTGTVSIEQNA